MEDNLTGYELSRRWFDWCYENPDKVNVNHTAMYFFIVDHWNRLGQKNKFGLPAEMTKDALGIKNYRTFSSTFNDLIDFGFIKIHQRSKNQYSANIIALVKNTIATTKALTKATQQQLQKQRNGIVGVDNKNEQIEQIETSKRKTAFDFEASLLCMGVEKSVASDWMTVRKNKKASNTETAFKAIKNQIEKTGLTANECIETATEKSWSGFNAEWIKNLNNKQDGKILNNYKQDKNAETLRATINLQQRIASGN